PRRATPHAAARARSAVPAADPAPRAGARPAAAAARHVWARPRGYASSARREDCMGTTRTKPETMGESDVIDLLQRQHALIRNLFDEVERSTGDARREAFQRLRSEEHTSELQS